MVLSKFTKGKCRNQTTDFWKMSFFVALALLCMFVATVVAQTEVIIGLTAGSNSTLGVFFPGDDCVCQLSLSLFSCILCR